ncbi:flavin reductase family protein [Ancylobacter sp. MQZ15Z-1]|uniref:Flavin reductase family protein n=1 Tax=Ancylobacter mangrovi TaxID=2972472 RepID=A0A9X2PGN0_9HYPH|nr:flavin reductase family protein [Ancylobacter mangrovi]MCS0494188.1 flavin reductase family protein [Ancylobacter mangrovi]
MSSGTSSGPSPVDPPRFAALALGKVYQLIEPGPVVLLATARRGKANVMTMSWHMMVEFTPPLIACIVSPGDHSFAALKATRECVIAVPSVEMAETVVGIGNCSGADTDKFARFPLTALPASKVRAPLIGECFANLECKVVNTRLVNAYALFVLECVAAWHDPARAEPRTIHHAGYGRFKVDGEVITLASRMP